MIHIFDIEDFYNANLASAVPMGDINLFDAETDDRQYLAELVFGRLMQEGKLDKATWAACHGAPYTFLKIKYASYGSDDIESQEPMSAQEVADIIRSSGEWNGEPVVLLSCWTGAMGNESVAYELSYLLGGCTVYAPTELVYFLDGGEYYVNKYQVDTLTDPILLPEYQEEKWIEIQAC